jgi:transposase
LVNLGHHPHHENLSQGKAVVYLSTINSNTLYVGIDLALKSNQVIVVNASGNQLASFAIGNDLPGATKLQAKIISLTRQYQTTTIKIGMEATSLYWWHLYQFLVQSETLNKEFVLEVYTLNPKLVKRFHKATADLDKTDPIDAAVIADTVRFGKVKQSHLIDELYEPLKRLTRFRYHLVTNLIVEKNYFLTHLFLKYSSWQKIKPFASAFGVTAENIISKLDPEEIISLSITELAERMISLSRNRIADPEKTALLIKEVANSSYQLANKLKEPIDLILTNTYDNIRYFGEKIKTIDAVIEKEFSRYPNPLTSIKGIGLVFAAGITAEIGEGSRFSTQSQVGKYAGLAWKKSQSGEFTAEETPRKPGNAYLRYYLVQAASSLRVHNEAYKAYYERKDKEVPKHQHKRALVLTARKLVRLCFAMLRDQRFYQPDYQKGDQPKS